MKENGVGNRKKTGQCSVCLLVRGGKFSLGENFFLYRGVDRGVGKKFITQKLSDFRPTLGLERKCMGWDFTEPGPNLVSLGNKFTK